MAFRGLSALAVVPARAGSKGVPRKNLQRLLSAFAALPASLRQRYPLVLVGVRGGLLRARSITTSPRPAPATGTAASHPAAAAAPRSAHRPSSRQQTGV